MSEENGFGGNMPAEQPRGQTVYLLLFLAAFALLGAFAAMELVFLVRGLGGALVYVLARLAWFLLPVGLLFAAFLGYRTVRLSFGGGALRQAGLLGLAWFFILAGGTAWRVTWQSPLTKMTNEMDEQNAACRKHVASVLQVTPVSDSLTPGEGFIVLKASFLSTVPLTVHGGGWLESGMIGLHFHSELRRAELAPGVAQELEIHLVANPEYSNIPRLAADGPYSFKAIHAYVEDKSKTADWKAIGGDCKAAVITDFLTSKAYKATDFGREPWTGERDSSFHAAAPAKTEQSPEEKQRLIDEAAEQLRQADELLKDADRNDAELRRKLRRGVR